MSRIIKSFRVIEDNSIDNISTEELESEQGIDFEEAREEMDKMIQKSKEKAEQVLLDAENESLKTLAIAKSDAKKIIEDAKSEGLVLKEKHKSEGYSTGYDMGYSNGKKEGYEVSYREGKSEMDQQIEEVLDLKNGYIEDRKKLLEDLEPEIIEMVMDIYHKVIGNRLETDEEYILDLVSNGIKSLDPTEKLTIIVSKGDYEILLSNKNRILAEASLINELEIKYDINLVKGDCILETPKGNIDLSVKDQIKEVDSMLKKILNNE